MATTQFIKWLETFLEEKKLPFQSWEIEAKTGVHIIDSDFIIESIKTADFAEQDRIKTMLVKIDFINGDVNHFFKHLATGLANNY